MTPLGLSVSLPLQRLAAHLAGAAVKEAEDTVRDAGRLYKPDGVHGLWQGTGLLMHTLNPDTVMGCLAESASGKHRQGSELNPPRCNIEKIFLRRISESFDNFIKNNWKEILMTCS